jgi:hypothetical protein
MTVSARFLCSGFFRAHFLTLMFGTLMADSHFKLWGAAMSILRPLILFVLMLAGWWAWSVVHPWFASVPAEVWAMAGATCTTWLSLRAAQAIFHK